MKLDVKARSDMFAIAKRIGLTGNGVGSLFQNEMDITLRDVEQELRDLEVVQKYVTAYREECERLKGYL